jgi:cytochrome c-type biogenesis protein CcmH
MTLLWVSIALMTALMVLFFILPLHLARGSQQEIDQATLNKQVFQENKAQLNQEREDALIDEETYQAQLKELEERFLLDMDGLKESKNDAQPRQAMAGLLVCGLIASVASLAVYYKQGAVDELETAQNLEKIAGLSEQELLAKLEGQLKETPDNLEGHILLARTYMSLGRSSDAVKPLEQALRLTKGAEGEASISAQLAQALYFTNPSVIPDRAVALIDTALELEPMEPTALGVSGIFAFEQKNYEKAIREWQKILTIIDEGPNAASLRQGIQTAQQRLSEQTSGDSGAAQETEKANQVSIKVAVGIADDLVKDYSADTRVFVYARHASGPKMPLAIQSLTVGALPVSLELDSSMSMAGMANLSDASHVQIVARISLSGSAMPSEGDVQVMSKSLDVNSLPDVVVLELKR